MLLKDGTDRVLRVNGVEYARFSEADFQIVGTLEQVETTIVTAGNSLLPSSHHIHVKMFSKTPLNYAMWIGPAAIEPDAGWWSWAP